MHDDLIAPALLGLVELLVSPHYGFAQITAECVDHDTHAQGHTLTIGQWRNDLDRTCSNTLRHTLCGLNVGMGQQQHEFFASKASHQVATTDTCLYDFRDGLEHLSPYSCPQLSLTRLK
jgi:hypothetical protein